MTRFRNKYRVESARLAGYDYASPGWYFVTICTKNREHYFGHIDARGMNLSTVGRVAEKMWREIPDHLSYVTVDEFVVMPNHVHGIIQIVETQHAVETQQAVETQHAASLRNEIPINGPVRGSLSVIIRSFKSAVTKWANRNQTIFSWQTRFHDHIIRDERSLKNIRAYIRANPANWENDDLFASKG